MGLNLVANELSWNDCVREAYEKNPELRSSMDNLSSKEYSVKSSYSSLMPQINASMGYQQGTSYTSSTITPSYSARLSLSQSIFNSFYDYAKIKQAKASRESASASLDSVRAKLSAELKTAFADLLYSKSSIELNKNIIKRRKDNLSSVELRFESGRENKGSVLLSKAYLEQANYDLIQAENNTDVAMANLARVLGRTEYTDFSIKNDIPTLTGTMSPDFKNIALDTPEYKIAIAQENLARANLTQARSGFLPSLMFSGEYGRLDSKWFPDKKAWSLGLTLSIPLFNSGRDYYSTNSASYAVDSEVLTRQDLLNRLISRLKKAYNEYRESIQKLIVDESFQKALSVRAEIARSMYNNGLMSFTDWDLIENDLINRQKTVLSSQREKTIKEAQWEQIQGKGVRP
jgi:outer membrane protein TolC